MKKRIASMIAVSMATVILFGSAMVFADSEYTASTGSVAADIDASAEPIGQDETQDQHSEYYGAITTVPATKPTCNVYATLPSSFTVIIPKTVILEGATNGSGSYTVRVTGDIAGNESVVVKPDATVTMKQEGKDDVTAAISQNSVWDYSGLVAPSNAHVGTITASGLTAGSWVGTFNFDISIATGV